MLYGSHPLKQDRRERAKRQRIKETAWKDLPNLLVEKKTVVLRSNLPFVCDMGICGKDHNGDKALVSGKKINCVEQQQLWLAAAY